MSTPLKIIIFDGSFKTTTFINRLVLGLSKNHQVYVLGFNNSIKKKLPNVHYKDLGSSQKGFNLIMQSKLIATRLLIKTGNFKLFFKTIKNIFTLNKKQLQQDNFNATLQFINPDIIHVQWQSLLSWCEEELEKGTYKFVLSQRGYQSNVRPFVNRENFSYLEKLYPKFAGFHSVSKSISKVGDKIYDSNIKIDTVVYSGFDFKKLPFVNKYNKPKTLQLLSIGRKHWIKGFDYAIKACKELKNLNIDFNYKIIGGLGDEELLYLIDDLQLQDQVELLGQTPQNEVYRLMQQSSVLLITSIKEGLPNVAVEAMALGLPVISTKCGGVEELIIDAKTGFLIPTQDVNAIVESVIKFNKMKSTEIDIIIKNARVKVENQHSNMKMIMDMESLYKKVHGSN